MPKLEAQKERTIKVLFSVCFWQFCSIACNVLIRNTILRFFGLIPVAVIKGKERGAGSRRLLEEMGFKTELKELFILFIRPV
jgi:hypothetical protein